MKDELSIPPMPLPDDFRDDAGFLLGTAYGAALKAWERVAERIIEAHKSAAFWMKEPPTP